MIKVRNISYTYPHSDTQILNDVSIDIPENQSIVLMGQNGSGKTTFARCLNGLLETSSGSIDVDDLGPLSMDNLTQIRKRISMVFQNPDNQIVSATVEREIAFGLENIGMPYEQMHERVNDMLEKFHLEKYRQKSPHYLSGGEKQRLAIASVMAMQPHYLILDEPTSLLDPKSRREILDIINHINETPLDHPITTILITQFADEATDADRLIIFSKGEIVMDDNPMEIFSQREKLYSYGLEPPLQVTLSHYFGD